MNLNLARKWRSRQFNEIVGQPLAVRLIMNSLYRNLLFPVYLLSGTRGTGKTSTGRIFAAALNCEKLEAFQKDPKNIIVPCLSCASCTAMLQMNHPDFIEIDAASHTGVDNVRQIIDAASFVPVLGKKKIYLIDEAHMLSKAAFNAFLKILEEPPQTAVFLLATTDSHKIIPTVLSRCFQIFFDPIKPTQVVEHLQYICKQEGLEAEPEALLLIAQETEGSMRDALNLLERLRSLPEIMNGSGEGSRITKQAVIHVLGSIDEDRLIEVLTAVVANDPSQVLTAVGQVGLEKYNPGMIWKKLVETLRRSLWLKQGIMPDDAPVAEPFKAFIDAVSYQRLIRLLDLCYTYELSFAKTAVPGTMLEVLFLKMATEETGSVLDKKIVSEPAKPVASKPPSSLQAKPVISEPAKKQPVPVQSTPVVPKAANPVPVAVQQTIETEKPTGKWGDCLAEIAALSDPLVVSIFKQGAQVTEKEGSLEMTFAQDLTFFSDWLGNTQKIWQPIIDKFYGAGTKVVPHFTGAATKKKQLVAGPIKPMNKPVPTQAPTQPTPQAKSPAASTNQASNKASTQSAGQSSGQPRPAARPYQKVSPQPAGKPATSEEIKQSQVGSLLLDTFSGKLLVETVSKENA